MTIDSASEGWVPDACTLPTIERPLRIAEFDTFFTESVLGVSRPERTRLDLVLAADAEPAGRDLAARESQCCSFFAFDFEVGEDAVEMRIGVPAGHVDVLDALEAQVRVVLSAR